MTSGAGRTRRKTRSLFRPFTKVLETHTVAVVDDELVVLMRDPWQNYSARVPMEKLSLLLSGYLDILALDTDEVQD